MQATPHTYDDVMLGANRIALGKAMHTGMVTWALKKELRSGVASPILLTGPDATGLALMNEALARQFRDAVLDALTMEDYEPGEKVLYADSRFVAIGGTTGIDSGGTHASEFFAAQTWNLRNGDTVDWEGMMRPAPAGSIDLSRTDVFSATVLRELQRAARRDDEDCLLAAARIMECDERACTNVLRSRQRTGWQMFPTREGLAVAPDVYSETERGCRGETVVVPWREVRRGLKEPSDLLPK